MGRLSAELIGGLERHFPVASCCLLPALQRIDAEEAFEVWSRHSYYYALVVLLAGDKDSARRSLGSYWRSYEESFTRAMSVLGCESPERFRDDFEFGDMANHLEPGPLDDIITEVLFAIDLSEYGFTELKKLKRSNKRKRADFRGGFEGRTYAIEVKTIRGESGGLVPIVQRLPGTGRLRELQLQLLKVDRKISEKDEKAVKQLLSTKEELGLDGSILAIKSEFIGTSAAIDGSLSSDEARAVAQAARRTYPEVDHIAFKWMVDRPTPILIDPDLPRGG